MNTFLMIKMIHAKINLFQIAAQENFNKWYIIFTTNKISNHKTVLKKELQGEKYTIMQNSM